MKQINIGKKASAAGALTIAVTRTERAPFAWRLKNLYLNPRWLRGWLAHKVVVPIISRTMPLVTIKGELEVRVKRLSEGERKEWIAMRDRLQQAGYAPEVIKEQLRAYSESHGKWINYGIVSRHVVTNAGVAFLVDDWDGDGEDITTLNYHGIGTDNTAEAAGDTALGTEVTGDLNPDNTRATGTVTQPAANQLRTTGTLTVDGAVTVEEHGLFSQAATGGGTLWDRSLTGGQSLGSGDSIQTQYTVTFTAGS